MFNINEINNELILFSKYINYNATPLTNVIYQDSKSMAHINVKELESGVRNIYISNELNNYSVKYQKSVLWHEFTHLYDYETFRKSDVSLFMSSYSECHAEEIAQKYILEIDINQTIDKLETPTLFLDLKIPFYKLLYLTKEMSIKSLNMFIDTRDPYQFSHASDFFMHMCGTLSILQNGDSLINMLVEQYPKKVQKALNAKGYNCGEADGIMGTKTRQALKDFQKDNKLTIDGVIGTQVKKALDIS